MDALAADRQLGESPRKMFAFESHSEEDHSTQANKWKAKNVTPILYLQDCGHTNLHRTLNAWANTYGDGVSGKEHIVVQGALARPVTSTQQDDFVGRVLWALSDPRGLPAKQFAEMNPVPSLEWLEPLSEEGFSRDSLAGFSVEPATAVDEDFKFSLTDRPAPYTLAPSMALVDAGLRIPTKAATDSDPKRPLWPGVEFGVVIVAVGCSLDVIFVRRGQGRWR